MDEVEELFEEPRAADDHRVVVDASGPGRVLPALDLHDRCDRLRLVGEEDVVVGRDDPEDRRRGDEQKGAGSEKQAGGGEPPLQRRLRVTPPSTGTTAPVT